MPTARFKVFLLIVWVVAAACTNSPYPSGDQQRKVLYVPYDEAPKTLDPAVAYSTVDHEVLGKIYDTLLAYHYLKRPYTLIPSLAADLPSLERLEDGGLRYRFPIRSGLVFQDDPCFCLSAPGKTSRAVTSNDFAFELMRVADPAVDSPVGESFSSIDGFRDFGEKLVQRRREDPSFANRTAREQYDALGGIAGVKTPSPTLLEITLSRPYPQILYWFAMPFTAPMPWEAVEYYSGKDGHPELAEHPVGAGPYRLAVYDRQSRIVLAKNEKWYGVLHPEWKAPAATYPDEGEPGDREAGRLRPEAVGQPLPFIERIELRRDKERIPAFNKFLQGYYDKSAIIRESFDRVVQGGALSPEMQARGMQLAKTVTPGIYYIGFNMEDGVVGQPGGERSRKLRQAMSLAVDSAEFTRLFLNGRGIPAQSVIPPGIFGYDEDYRNPFRGVDLDRARALLAEAGYPEGVDPKTRLPLHLTFDSADTSPDGRLRYQFFVNAWRQLGIDVEIAATTYNKFQEKVRKGAYQIFLWGWVGDYPDPENFMFLLWSEMARSKQGGPNTANYANPKYDELFLRMKTMDDGPERRDLIRRARGLLETDRPWIELYYPESYALYQGWLKNVKPMGLGYYYDQYADIDPAERAAYRTSYNRPVLWPAYALFVLMALLVGPGVRTFFRERQ